jgi:hypothetical protein
MFYEMDQSFLTAAAALLAQRGIARRDPDPSFTDPKFIGRDHAIRSARLLDPLAYGADVIPRFLNLIRLSRIQRGCRLQV